MDELYRIESDFIDRIYKVYQERAIDITGTGRDNYELMRDLVDDYESGVELEENTEENISKLEEISNYYYKIVDTQEKWITSSQYCY